MAGTSQAIAFQGTFANFLTGETHVLYASLVLGLTGSLLIGIGFAKRNRLVLALGVTVLVAAAGIAADVTAHGYAH